MKFLIIAVIAAFFSFLSNCCRSCIQIFIPAHENADDARDSFRRRKV